MKNTKYSIPIGLEILKAAAIVAVILGASAALFISYYSSTQADRLVTEGPVVETAVNLPVMYTATWCGYCRRAKAYMAQKHIPYREVDVESAAGKVEYANTGERGVPVLVRGGEHFVGFSEKYYESIFSTPSDVGSSSGST